MKILVLNGGSSTLKALLCDCRGGRGGLDSADAVWQSYADWGRSAGKVDIHVQAGAGISDVMTLDISAPGDVLEPVLRTMWQGDTRVMEGPTGIGAVGHRIVHGGRAFRSTTRITSEVKAAIAGMAELAPEHNRLELEAIEAAERILGSGVPQFAVFDTAFHTTIPRAAAVYPGPYRWVEEGVLRYGFHGISHQYVSRRAAEILGRDPGSLRMVTCHLGNGCSLAAVRNGESIDTTMGFTPLEGLMMGTRSGSIDPGILIYLARHRGWAPDQLDRILNKESGLKGLSGVSGDMRAVLEARGNGNDRAALAFEVFVHRLCREIGAMTAVLGGIDALVFTAGIGEHTPPVRQAVCDRLAFLGMTLDLERNAVSPVDEDIAGPGSKVRILVVHTEEDREIARECVVAMQENQT